MKSLPTLRRKILRSFLVLVGLYAVLGLMLLASFNIASKTTPKLLHLNYDSVAAATRMKESWTALQYPSYSSQGQKDWIKRFEEALAFEESNITEPGEKETATLIRKDWDQLKPSLGRLKSAQFEPMVERLEELRSINEQGMFHLAADNEKLSRDVLAGTLIFFLLSLLVSIAFADQLSQRLSRPLKSIAEALHRRPGFGSRLKLPEATNLETLILITELGRLWERLAQADQINVTELVKQKNRMETLLESVEDGLLVLNAEGRVTHCNDYLATLVGLPREQIQNQLWADLPTAGDNYLKLRGLLAVEMIENPQVELEWNRSKAYFSARARKISGSRPGESGVLYLLHDVTEKKQREKFRSEFIDLLSHELKTPLQSLGTASELLSQQRTTFTPDAAALIETIGEDVQRIRAVAQEFVQVTQSHSKILKLKLELIAVSTVLPEWLKPFSVVAKDRGVKIEYRREGSEVIWGNLDLVKFPWVVSNILSNAVRYSPSEGIVSVLLTDREGGVEIRIKDQGPGISEAEQSRMFEPFYQGASTSGSGRGLFGVGLTIAKEVLEAHEGRIEYHRLEPQGSEFRILLPFPPISYGEAPKGEAKSWTH